MRLDELKKVARRRKLDQVLVTDQANVRALTGVNCDNAVLTLDAFYTDFRYVPMVHRVAPDLVCRDLKELGYGGLRRIGYESSISHARFLALGKKAPRAEFVDISKDLADLRAVKTADEIARLRAAERLTCEIWAAAKRSFRAGMTELEMARLIKTMMIERGEGEAFDTIVCVGANAAECHHEPDGTVWDGRASVLVDMGVKLGGVCSDMTRNIKPKRRNALYERVYELVLTANRAAIAAAKPGVKCRDLDWLARRIIARGGYGKCFGHSLGHGVGYEIHEAPGVSKLGETVLKSGMLITIEPGVYLEGQLGIRIEDLILITETDCEVLSSSSPK